MRKLGALLASLMFGCQPGQAQETAVHTASTAPLTAASETATAATANPSSAASAGPNTTADEAVTAPEGMVKIPAGIYLMGADHARGNPEEKPAHEAIVAGFYMDVTEVTVAAYQTCVAAGTCPKAHIAHRFCNTKPKLLSERSNHPINCIDLKMADAFCRWADKRLPSEREWEYAASGGRERRRFSWGATNPTPDNNCYDHPGGSCPVKQFAAGAFGLHDMTGNVWEWTASQFAPYPSKTKPDIIEKRGRLQYVYRGGSWSRRFPKWMRNVLRNRYEPDKYSAAIGMRCVRSIEPLECPADTKARDGVCERVSGDTLCEPRHRWNGKQCVPDVAGEQAKLAGTHPTRPREAAGSAASGTADTEPAPQVISRSRTPQHDTDCKRHWPKTPASYLFKGGKNYPSRKPAVSNAGCVPRDMGWSWTSACCPG